VDGLPEISKDMQELATDVPANNESVVDVRELTAEEAPASDECITADSAVPDDHKSTDVIIHLPKPDCVRQGVFDSVCSKINISYVSRLDETDRLILLGIGNVYCFGKLSHIWDPDVPAAMEFYKKSINSEHVDDKDRAFRGERVLIQSSRFCGFLEEQVELLREEQPLAFCKAVFTSLQSQVDKLFKLTKYKFVKSPEFRESSLLYDCFSFAADFEKLSPLVQSVGWDEFFVLLEEYWFAKNFVIHSLLKIICFQCFNPEDIKRMVESGVYEEISVVTLRNLEKEWQSTDN
jgi:hypothetical protein